MIVFLFHLQVLSFNKLYIGYKFGTGEGFYDARTSCPCEDFKITSQRGNFVGNCLSRDQNGKFWCYVMKGCVNCDAGDSGTFPQYCKNYSNCRLSSMVNWQG